MNKSYQLLLFSSQAEYSEGERNFIWPIDFHEILGEDYEENQKFNLTFANIIYYPYNIASNVETYPFYVSSDCMIFRHGRFQNQQFTVQSGVEFLGITQFPNMTTSVSYAPFFNSDFTEQSIFYNAFTTTFTMCRKSGYLRLEYVNPAQPFFSPTFDQGFPENQCFLFVFERLNDKRNNETGWTVNTIPKSIQTSFRFVLSSKLGFGPETLGNVFIVWPNIDLSQIILNPELNTKYMLVTKAISIYTQGVDQLTTVFEIRFYGIPFGFKCYRPGSRSRPYQVIGIHNVEGDSLATKTMYWRNQFINTFTLRSLKAPVFVQLVDVKNTTFETTGDKANPFVLYLEIHKL